MWTPSTDQIITREQREAESEAAAWAALRAERDRRLADSDWVVLRSLETSEPVPPEWRAYRQALRDLPETTGYAVALPDWPSRPTDEFS